MTTTVLVCLLVPVAYLVGTIPTAVMVARAAGRDVTAEGSGNPGASNVVRLLGWKAGLAVMVGDFLKGAACAGVGLAVAGRPGAWILGVAAVLGHVLPVTRRFKGGKGVATAGGALVVLYPVIVLVLGVVWFVIARLLKKASIGSLVGAILFPVLVAVAGYPGWEVAATAALAVFVIARHAANIRRLLEGRELGVDGPPEA